MRKIVPRIGYQFEHIAQFRSVSTTIKHRYHFHHVVVILLMENNIPDMIQSKITLRFLEHIHELPLNLFPPFQNLLFLFNFHNYFLVISFRDQYLLGFLSMSVFIIAFASLSVFASSWIIDTKLAVS